jgi:predicted metal-binding protein
MVTDEQIYESLEGFEDINAMAIVSTDELVFNDGFRAICADNTCGNYNANYSCPPYCGTPEQMKQKALSYKKALVVQTSWQVWDCMNMQEVKPKKHSHNVLSFKIIDVLKALGLDVDAMMAGPCSQCEKECMMPKGKPCVLDYKIYSCASAYCLNVAQLCDTVCMDYFSDNNHVQFFSLFLFDKK